MRFSVPRQAALLLGIFATSGWAQQFPFQMRLTTGNFSATVQNGSPISFSSNIGQAQAAQLTATYVGSGKVTIATGPQVFGSTEFTATMAAALPLTLNPGDNINVNLQFLPTSAVQATAQFSLPFTETIFTTNPPTQSANQINFTLQGSAPSLVLSYILQTDLNVVPLQSGGTVPFPDTLIHTTSQATVNISNVGSAPGQVSKVEKTGSAAFTLVGLPLFPVSIAAAQQLQILIRYTPTVVGPDSAQIQITLDPGTAPLTVNLQGNGVSPMFTYNILAGDQVTPVTPPGPIVLPDTNLGAQNSIILQVKNTGNTTGTISSPPGLNGPGFSLSGGPVFPQILKPNDSFAFTVTFTPTQPGDQTGQLLVGSDLFTLMARGLGPKLGFSYGSNGTMTTLGPTDAVVFSPTPIGQTAQLDFVITNNGTTAATVSNIGIGESAGPFSVASSPPLPTSLDPGASVQFTLKFAPVTTGFVGGTLHIDTIAIPLVGSGTAPPPLPTYTIQGPSGNVAPQSQPAIRLSLSSQYPIDLTGVLTLTTSSDLISDPAIQFATGGRTVPFVIPANTTDANFANQGPQIRLQTGTVASTIILTPSFATKSGGVDVTPASPATLQFAVAAAPPTLLAVQATNETPTGFVLNVTGYSTTRTLTSMTVQFTAASGFNIGSSQATIDLRGIAAVWFQSAGSQAFGGQFEVSIPFNLQGTPPTGTTLLQTIASVAATVSNDRGASNSMQINLP